MSKYHFTFKELFMFGWTKTTQHAWFIFLTFIIISIIASATVFNPFLSTLVVGMAALSLTSISLMIARNHTFSFSDLLYPLLSPRRVIKFFTLSLFYVLPVLLLTLTTIILVIGSARGSVSVTVFGLIFSLIFFAISLYVTVRFNFFPYVAVEHEHSPVKDLINMSYKLTENNFGPVFGFLFLAVCLNLVGLLFFGLGLLITVPVTVFASAHLYDKLKSHTV